MKKKRGTPRRRKPSPKKRAVSTGLARRTILLPAPAPIEQALGDDMQLGALGLVEVKLTPQEEGVLSEPVNPADVLVKPTGQPYLSHPAYTRWFNRAFGRLGWGIVPRAKPMKVEKSVVCPYVLYIHGTPAAFAMGEQEYHDNNREQTYGDALEATVASALRRCAKRLGVGLELWDRSWTNAWLEQHTVKVWCEVKKRDGAGTENKPQWRRRNDPPFWNETKGRGSSAAGGQVQQDTRAHHDATGEEPITQKQRQRLAMIAKDVGRPSTEVAMWLKVRFGLDSSAAIKRRDYEFICKALEHPGALPMAED